MQDKKAEVGSGRVERRKPALSGSRQLALVALFSALAMVLRLTVEFPFPLAPYLKLEVWEVPVYIALFAYGGRFGLGVATVVYLIVQAFASGPLPTGPVYNFIAILSTMGGAALVLRLIGYWKGTTKSAKAPLLSIASGAASRVAIMTVVNFLALPQPYPIGFSIPVAAMPPILVVTAIFNLVVASYSIAISFPIARRIAPA